MKKDNQKIIPVEELGIHFDDRKVYDLDQKLFNGEITFEEYCQAIDKAWITCVAFFNRLIFISFEYFGLKHSFKHFKIFLIFRF